MIQLNLLPDVKSKYIATERMKRLTILSAAIVCSVVIGVVLILIGVVYGSQKSRLKSLDNQISSNSSKLQDIDGLNKILTIQNQLNSLTELHDKKPVTSRLFEFLPQITPSTVNIANISIKFEDNSITVSGTAPSLEIVNKFIDTLKFTQYNSDQNTDKLKAFSAVVLTSFSKNAQEASYSISATFDPQIFSGSFKKITLEVPKITSTRSQTEQPDALFKEPAKTDSTINQTGQ